MKRILTILLIVMMVFSITGCDPDGRAQLAGFMGMMKENVMGSDMEDAKKTKEAAKVTEFNKPTDGKVTIGGKEVVSEKPVLPEFTPEKQADVVQGFVSNEKVQKETLEFMNTKIEDTQTKEATQASAAIMKDVLVDVNSQITPEMKKENPVVEKLANSLESIQTSLNDISTGKAEITQGDVTTIQLVQTFMKTVNDPVNQKIMNEDKTIPDEVLKGASDLYTVSSKLSPASVLALSDFSALIPKSTKRSLVARDINTLDVNPDAVENELSSLKDLKVSPKYQKYISVAYTTINKILGNDDFVAQKKSFGFHKIGFENYVNMLAGKYGLTFDADGNAVLEKASALESAKNNDAKLASFLQAESLLQYAAAEVFSEGDDYYIALLDVVKSAEAMEAKKDIIIQSYIDLFGDDSLQGTDKEKERADVAARVDLFIEKAPLAFTADFPMHVDGLLHMIFKSNTWMETPTDNPVDINLPKEFEAVSNLDPTVLGAIATSLIDGSFGANRYFYTSLNAVNGMIAMGDVKGFLVELGMDNVNSTLTKLINDMYN